MKRYLLVIALLCLTMPAQAQNLSKLCVVGSASNSCIPVNAANPLPVSPLSGFPTGSTPINGNSTGTTGAVVGTLAKAASVTTYICGFSVSAIGGTAAVGPITVAGLITASQVYQLASSAGGSTLSVNFNPCIPASAVNTDITTTTTADGTASNVSVNSWGFRQ